MNSSSSQEHQNRASIALRSVAGGGTRSTSNGALQNISGVIAVLCWFLALAAGAEAKVLLTVDEALELAFPGCTTDRSTVFLTADEKAKAKALAKFEVEQNLVYAYRASCDGVGGGTAYFDTHRVRTLEETIMIVIDSNQVTRVEVLAFREPLDYLPRDRWYEQFARQQLRNELELGRNIRPVAGATLTARATTEAVRRVLALHLVIAARTQPSPEVNQQ